MSAGEVWATEQFEAALGSQPSLYRAVEVEGGLNIKKAGSNEADTLIRVFRILAHLG